MLRWTSINLPNKLVVLNFICILSISINHILDNQIYSTLTLSRCAWPTRPWWTRRSASSPLRSASKTPPSSPSLAARVRASHFKSVSTSQNCSLVPLVKVSNERSAAKTFLLSAHSFRIAPFWPPVQIVPNLLDPLYQIVTIGFEIWNMHSTLDHPECLPPWRLPCLPFPSQPASMSRSDQDSSQYTVDPPLSMSRSN